MKPLGRYREVWLVDFEFTSHPGEQPRPIVMVAKELYSGRIIRLADEDLRRRPAAPFDTGPDVAFVAYYAPAEMGCFLALGWPMPDTVIDLYVEFRNLTNGLEPLSGTGLLGALAYFDLPLGDALEKEEMRSLAMRGGPFSENEIEALMDYCQSDVDALDRLWRAMSDQLDPSALWRGEYTKAVAMMECNGIPVDFEVYDKLRSRRSDLVRHLVSKVDPTGGLWSGESFSLWKFEAWLKARAITWPRLPSGTLNLDKSAWSDMAKMHPVIKPIAELRATLSQLRNFKLEVGADGRNRAMLSPFGSKTGRNQPSTTKFIFGLPSSLRGLIRPTPGMALAYIDWEQQEFAIAAVLSGDRAMIEAYVSSDPYLAFAIRAGAAPSWATKETHADIRAKFKTVVLGVGYCMSAFGLAARLGISLAEAEELLSMHRRCYPDFWKWSQAVADHAQLNGKIHARFGWTQRFTSKTKDRSIRNFPCQANGAEMMRLAAIYATEAGIKVCAPVHDAFLIEAPNYLIEEEVARMRACMAKASADVLDGFDLRTDVEIIRHPDRFGGGKNQLWRDTLDFIRAPSPTGQGTPAPPGSPV